MDINSYLKRLGYAPFDSYVTLMLESEKSIVEKSKLLCKWFSNKGTRIYTRVYDTYIMLSYPDHRVSNNKHQLDFNGVIFDIKTLKIVSVPLRHMSSAYVPPADMANARIYHAIDGTTVTMFYSPGGTETDSVDGWIISTAHNISAHNVDMMESPKLLKIIRDLLTEAGVDMAAIDRASTYTLMMQHPIWNISHSATKGGKPSLTFVSQNTVTEENVNFNYDIPAFFADKLNVLTPFETVDASNSAKRFEEVHKYMEDHRDDRRFNGLYVFAVQNIAVPKVPVLGAINVHKYNYHIPSASMLLIRKHVYTPMYYCNTIDALALHIYLNTTSEEYSAIKVLCPLLVPLFREYTYIFKVIKEKLTLGREKWKRTHTAAKLSAQLNCETGVSTHYAGRPELSSALEVAVDRVVNVIYDDEEYSLLIDSTPKDERAKVVKVIVSDIKRYATIYFLILPPLMRKIITELLKPVAGA